MSMLHPFFLTIVKRPDLVIEHFAAYAALFNEEASNAGSQLMGRIVALLLAVLLAVLFLGLTGIAVMLGVIQHQFHWILLAVPAFALLLFFLVLARALQPLRGERFSELRAQFKNDVQALRAVA